MGRRVEAKLSAQLLGVSRVPLEIKRLRITEQFVHAHPERQIALLGKIANTAQHTDWVRDRIEAKHAHRAALCFQQTEDMFDEGGFARAVFADQSEDHAPRNTERYIVESELGTETPAQTFDFDHGVCWR